MADISQIKLPDGQTYDIKDTIARNTLNAITDNGTFVIAWNGSSTPTPANIPKDIEVVYNNQTYTGTLAGSSDTLKKFYLVKSAHSVNGISDIYDEYITIDHGASAATRYTWEKIGNTQIALSSIVSNVTTTTKKLNTTTITGVSGSTTASKVTITGDAPQSVATGATTANNSTDAWLKGWSVSNELLTLSGVSLTTVTPQSVSASNVTVPKAASSATTVATGGVSDNGSGASIVTGISVDRP